MPVNLPALPPLNPIAGIRIGTTNAGIKQTERDDLTLFAIDSDKATCSAVFTRNAFCAAPVILSRRHLAQAIEQGSSPRYLLINSGNANAGTGELGMSAALATCQAVADLTQSQADKVLPFSTGVIGQPLPVAKIEAALPQAFSALSPKHWEKAARAIMTTDTAPKGVSHRFVLNKKDVTITGIAKGAGMIRPDMATMLAFIATDVGASQTVLDKVLTEAVNRSFNRISIDGDTSTNDSCVLVATGQKDVWIDSVDDPHFPALQQVVTEVCMKLAQAIVRDGEGATKFITVQVEEGQTPQECLAVAYTIAHSPLVKTAFFASDANWGRILAAVGRSGLTQLEIEKIKIYINDVCIVENGGVAASYTEAQGQAAMANAEITVRIALGRGNASEQVWTCDFSHEYVTINAEYRT